MKSVLFGLAVLCALPGCCGWCKKEKKCVKKCDTGYEEREGRREKKNGMMEENGKKMSKSKKDMYK